MRTVRVPLSPASAAVVRHQLVDELSSRVPDEVLDSAALVVSELVGNAVRHGRALPGGGLLARWELVDAALRVEVVDGGDGPLAGPPPAAAETSESGRGLELVAALAARWGRARAEQGTAVWAELSRVPASWVPGLPATAGQVGPGAGAGPGPGAASDPDRPQGGAGPLPPSAQTGVGTRTLRLPEARPLPVARHAHGSRALRLP